MQTLRRLEKLELIELYTREVYRGAAKAVTEPADEPVLSPAQQAVFDAPARTDARRKRRARRCCTA